MKVAYALGNGGRSWVIGVGTDYPTSLWHKQSYASLINWDARSVPEFSIRYSYYLGSLHSIIEDRVHWKCQDPIVFNVPPLKEERKSIEERKAIAEALMTCISFCAGASSNG